MESDNKIKEAFEFVASYESECDDWIEIKKEVMKLLPSNLRKRFSRRDQKTKNHHLNNFEKEMINYYHELTGIKLVLRSLNERRRIFGTLHR